MPWKASNEAPFLLWTDDHPTGNDGPAIVNDDSVCDDDPAQAVSKIDDSVSDADPADPDSKIVIHSSSRTGTISIGNRLDFCFAIGVIHDTRSIV